MKPLRLMSGTLLSFLIVTSWATANPRVGDYRSKADGTWNAPGSWQTYDRHVGWRDATPDDGAPNMDHRVTVQSGHTIRVDSKERVRTLRIERAGADGRPGTLKIGSAAGLLIVRALDMAREPEGAASARIVFSGQGGEPGILATNATLDVYGDIQVTGAAGGVIVSPHPRNLISVGRHARLTASGGPLLIHGLVEMDGAVLANGPHEVAMTGAGVREGSSGRWQVAHPEAVLRFETDRPISLRSGEIFVAKGTLDVVTDLHTTGSFKRTEGQVRVAPQRVFDVRGRVIEPTPLSSRTISGEWPASIGK